MVRRMLLYLLLMLVFLVFISWYFSNIFIYLIFSLVLATLLRPLTNTIHQIHVLNSRIPRPIAIIFSFSIVIVVVTLFVMLFIPLFSEQVKVLSQISYDSVLTSVSQPFNSIEQFLIENKLTVQQEGFLFESIRESLFGLLSEVDFTLLLNNLISVTGGLLVGFLAVSFITFFLLLENGILRRQIIALIPNQYFEVFIAAMFKIEKLLSNYLIGLLFQMASIFSIASLGLSILGVKYALTIAVFAAVANLIPYLGPMLGASFGIVVGVSTSGDISLSQDLLIVVVKILSVFGIVQAADNILLQPLIFSKSVKAHPLEIFVIIFAGATIAGIPGMIAAIPTYTILRVSTIEVYAGFKGYQIFKK
ncbi:MAG: AI-2E family transporter [Imperialibacter sp.]|uniref:AI-2E family transporter n=1 Tax=Imperialibacter sp. TaxID=2038411 RepID=UPI003A842E1D